VHSCCIALRPGHRAPGKLVRTALWLVSGFSAFGALSSTTSVGAALNPPQNIHSGRSIGLGMAGPLAPDAGLAAAVSRE